MRRVLLIGNPNVGKSTMFNSLTKSNEHVGNFHGVTVEEKRKIITFENEKYEIVDLPGMYSLNSFSYEEEVAKKIVINTDALRLVLVDANSIRKNLYLCLQLLELDLNFNVLINNYDYFLKKKNKINIDKLNNNFGVNCEIVNAKKIKFNNILLKINKKNKNKQNNLFYLNNFIEKIKNKFNIDNYKIILALNGEFSDLNIEQISYIKSLYPEIIKARYNYIDEVLKCVVETNQNYVYGVSKADRFLLNPFIMIVGFLVVFFSSFYAIFFLIGPLISDVEHAVLNFLIINPCMNLLYMTTDNIWLIEFFRAGVFNSISTVISFVPQVMLMFVFLTLLEDSGVIARMAYVLDDFLTKFGLNGKAIYIMLLGLGCNTMSTTAARNMNGKNLKIKTAILNPYISCMARLPVYVLIASAFFGKFTFFIVAVLYVLGLVVSLLIAIILNKTLLKTKSSELLLEFPPMKGVDIKHLFQVGITNAKDFFKRVFTIVLTVGIIVWILTHTQFNLKYTENISESTLFCLASKISFIFAPIGLNSAGLVTALIVGILAKELIVSTISICNNAQSQKILISSLVLTTSVVHFSLPSAVSFLIFSLLYSPCASNLAVIKKETSKFYMWFSLISQFTIAYMLSFVVYQALTKGFIFSVLVSIVIAAIMLSIAFILKKARKNKCLTCGRCNK